MCACHAYTNTKYKQIIIARTLFDVFRAVHHENKRPRYSPGLLPRRRAARLHLPDVQPGSRVGRALDVEALTSRRGRQERLPVLEVKQCRALP